MCRKCVAMADHHCIWIRGCVGEGNLKFFIAFLILHQAMLIYAFVVAIYVLKIYIDQEDLWNREFEDVRTGEVVSTSWLILFLYLMKMQEWVLFLSVLCGVMALAVSFFAYYQIRLVLTGLTTNESAKFNRLGKIFEDPSLSILEKTKISDSIISAYEVYKPTSALDAFKRVIFA